jgi:hypothetical protein
MYNEQNIEILGQSLLPVAQRQTKFSAFIFMLLSPLVWLKLKFDDFRTASIEQIKYSGQTIALTALLKQRTGLNVNIIHNQESGVLCSLEVEASYFIAMGLSAESEPYVAIALTTDTSGQLTTDFKIIAPSGANVEQIANLTKQYKQAGKTFEVTTP